MNTIILVDNNKNEEIIDKPPPGVIVEWLGCNGCLKFHSSSKFKNCKFQINDGDLIEVGKKSKISGLFIRCAAIESKVKIGKHFIISSGEFILGLGGKHQSITIEDDCLFSSHVAIFTSDGHSIIDKEDDKVLNNIGGNIYIGKHCWLGYRSVLTKSARLPSNTIVMIK